jgi:hypothetical protein
MPERGGGQWCCVEFLEEPVIRAVNAETGEFTSARAEAALELVFALGT